MEKESPVRESPVRESPVRDSTTLIYTQAS